MFDAETQLSSEPFQSSPNIQVRLEIIRQTFVLKSKERIAVPIGSVYVLAHDHETYDEGGLPEVYLAGEVVRKSPLRKDKTKCWVVELAEFPGRVTFRIAQPLAGISLTGGDTASVEARFLIRLYDPLLVLRRGGWSMEKEPFEFNKSLSDDLCRFLEKTLYSAGIQLWSGDETRVFGRIFSDLDDYLQSVGLRIDTVNPQAVAPSIIAFRRYPQALYEIALQFAQAERTVRHLISAGKREALTNKLGLSDRDLDAIALGEGRDGVALFRRIITASSEVKPRMITWLKEMGAGLAAVFIDGLMADKHVERSIKLSEQVMLNAIRNPMLTIGEWLQQEEGEPFRLTRFQRIENRLRLPPSI